MGHHQNLQPRKHGVNVRWLKHARRTLGHFNLFLPHRPPCLYSCLEGNKLPSKQPPFLVWFPESGGSRADFILNIVFWYVRSPIRTDGRGYDFVSLKSDSFIVKHGSMEDIPEKQKTKWKSCYHLNKRLQLGQTVDMLKAWEVKLENDRIWRIKALRNSHLYLVFRNLYACPWQEECFLIDWLID